MEHSVYEEGPTERDEVMNRLSAQAIMQMYVIMVRRTGVISGSSEVGQSGLCHVHERTKRDIAEESCLNIEYLRGLLHELYVCAFGGQDSGGRGFMVYRQS